MVAMAVRVDRSSCMATAIYGRYCTSSTRNISWLPTAAKADKAVRSVRMAMTVSSKYLVAQSFTTEKQASLSARSKSMTSVLFCSRAVAEVWATGISALRPTRHHAMRNRVNRLRNARLSCNSRSWPMWASWDSPMPANQRC